MDWDQIAGNWRQLAGEARKKWAKLTDDDLARVGGDREELAGTIQERYGKPREEARREVDEWRQSL